MDSSEGTERRSERKRKRKESYSPEGKKEGRKKKLDGQTSQNKSRVNRPYDVLPNGEPFSCHLCKCPYVVNPISKGVKKTGRSRHTPVPKIRTDTNTGREMVLCNACVQIFDRPQRRVAKAICAPTDEEKKDYLMEVDFFITTIKREFNDPLVEKLYCPMNQKKLCGCLQKYIQSTGNSHVPVFVTLMKEALELRKEKSYITDDSKKVKMIGLGNGHKKSKRYEEFVLSKRRVLKDDMRLCERATQKVLMYSNNFLHKRLKTENRPCRVERTRGKAALGQLPEFQNMMDLHCCSDNCVMLALTHKRLLQDWRDRALQGQLEARRVMAEMLTPAGATHINCYSFISMVTGCSQTTIARVYNQMINTGGDRDPPEHGMKRVWQDHYKLTKTSEGNSAVSSMISTDNLTQEVTSSDNVAQEVTSSHRLTNQYTAVDTASLDDVRHHKVAWMQDLAKTQQQQQLAVYLQDLMSAKNKQLELIQAQSLQRIPQLQHKPGDITHNALMKAPNISTEQLQKVPSPALLGIHPSIAGGQGHLHPVQGQTVMLQPPPQYGVNQSSITRQWNQSQCPLPVNVSQPNYMLTGDQQVVPVIPVFKHGSDGVMVPGNIQVVDTNNQTINQPQPMHILSTPHESIHTSEQGSENQNSRGYTHEMAAEFSNVSKVQTVNQTIISSSNLPQGQVLRQYQILTDQGTIQFQVPALEPNVEENAVSAHQSIENSTQYVSIPGNNTQSNNSNPNMYFHILPENTAKIDTLQTEQSAGLNNLSKKHTETSNSELIAQPMPPVELNMQNHQAVTSDVQSKQLIHTFQRKGDRNGNTFQSDHFHNNNTNKCINQTATVNSISTSTDHPENIKRLEHGSTVMQDSVSNINQVDHTSQPVNQPQLIVPVSYIPASHQNGTGNEQVLSQIQISLETYPTENNQPSFTQQIILPHGNVVTLPLMPGTTKDINGSKSQLIKNYRDNIDTANYSVTSENSAIQNLSRENLQLHALNQKDNNTVVDSRSNTNIKSAKSRNSSGNSKKSRNSSGSSEKSRKSVLQFSNLSRNETHQELGHSSLRPEHLTESHFLSKLNKSRHRQFSGNSEYGDRSRKSSGNSMISETSQTSGLTLSNLASPNIFLDKDKGIFFIQSMDGLEFNEIDSNHLADFIQAVEADQAGTVDDKHSHRNQSDNIRSDSEIQMLNQSGLLEAEIVNKSRRTDCEILTQSGRMGGNIQNEAVAIVDNFETQSANFLKCRHDIESQTGKSSTNLRMPGPTEGKTYREVNDEKHNEDIIEQIGDVRIHSQARSPEKRKSKETGKKHAANRPNKPSQTARFNNNEMNADASVPSAEDCVPQNRSTVMSRSFIPIAPKGATRSWSLDAPTATINTKKTSHNTPILSSLLARQPMRHCTSNPIV